MALQKVNSYGQLIMSDDDSIDDELYEAIVHSHDEYIKALNSIKNESKSDQSDLKETSIITKLEVQELQNKLAFADLFAGGSNEGSSIKLLLLKREHIKVIMLPDKNHQRGHFHIKVKKEYSASYSIDTLEKLAGFMPKKYQEPIIEWANKYKSSLCLTWDKLKAGIDIKDFVIEEDAA